MIDIIGYEHQINANERYLILFYNKYIYQNFKTQ